MSMRDLSGMRVALTRAQRQSEQSARDVFAHGGIPCVFPLLQFASTVNCTEVSTALDALRRGDVIAFTSENGVQFSTSLVQDSLMSAHRLGVRFAAVGERTAAALTASPLNIAPITPTGAQSGAGLAHALLPYTAHGERVLALGARQSRPELTDVLRAAGRQVQSIAVYETQACDASELWAAILGDHIDAVVFASPSAVHAFVRDRSLALLPKRLIVACIGETTRHQAEASCLRVDVMPQTPTLTAVLAALAAAP